MEHHNVNNSYDPKKIDSLYSLPHDSSTNIETLPSQEHILNRVPNPITLCNELTQSTFYPASISQRASLPQSDEMKLQEHRTLLQELLQQALDQGENINKEAIVKALNSIDTPKQQEVSTLNKARKLAGAVAELNGKLETGIKTASAVITDPKTISEKFNEQLLSYNALCLEIGMKEDEIKEEISYLAQETTPKEKSARYLSLNAIKRLQTILEEEPSEITLDQIFQKQNDHVQMQVSMTQTLNNLEVEWTQIVNGLEQACKQLQWFEVLKNKPSNIPASNYYKEYLGGRHPIESSLVSSPGFTALKDKTPLTEQLRLLKLQIKEISSETEALAHSTTHNLKNNIKDYEIECMKIMTQFKALAMQVQIQQHKVTARLEEIATLLNESKGKELTEQALASLKMYSQHENNLKKAPASLEAHHRQINLWETERGTIDASWKSIVTTMESSREQLNETIRLICHHLTPPVNPESHILEPVITLSQKAPAPTTAERAHKAAESFNSLKAAVDKAIKEIHDTTPSSINLWASFSGSSQEAITAIQDQYKELFATYRTAVNHNRPLIGELQKTIATTKKEIEENTAPEPIGLQPFLSALGRAKGQEETYERRAAKYQQEFNEVNKVHQEAQERLEEAEIQLEAIDATAIKYVNDRLARLSQAYHTGRFPTKSMNPPPEKAPTPEELAAKKQ